VAAARRGLVVNGGSSFSEGQGPGGIAQDEPTVSGGGGIRPVLLAGVEHDRLYNVPSFRLRAITRRGRRGFFTWRRVFDGWSCRAEKDARLGGGFGDRERGLAGSTAEW